MSVEQVSKAVSVAALALLLLHVFFPSLAIDGTTIALLVVAALPWLFPLIKTVELPGGTKIELRETKAATDKITVGSTQIVTPEPVSLTFRVPEPEDPLLTLRAVARTDPNLALVGFRIEIEKRLRRIALARGLEAERKSALAILHELSCREILPTQVMSGIEELIAFGNQAAHGVPVAQDAAEWVLDVGPSILTTLDQLASATAKDRPKEPGDA